jgi:hypothetical protein
VPITAPNLKPSAAEYRQADGFSFISGTTTASRQVFSGAYMGLGSIDPLYQHENLDFLTVVGFKLKGL